MLWGAPLDGLELRRAGDGSATLFGRFPYGVEAVLGRVGGREHRERFEAGALEPSGDGVFLLSQHEFARPLASTRAGTLEVRQGDGALEFEARIAPSVAATSYGRDALALVEAGLAVGLSPGFRVPEGGDSVRADGAALVRTVRRAELVELSVVTRPAFDAASVQARSWAVSAPARAERPARLRWRA